MLLALLERDGLAQLHLVVVDGHAEVRNPARLDHHADGEGLGGLGLQVRVGEPLAEDLGRRIADAGGRDALSGAAAAATARSWWSARPLHGILDRRVVVLGAGEELADVRGAEGRRVGGRGWSRRAPACSGRRSCRCCRRRSRLYLKTRAASRQLQVLGERHVADHRDAELGVPFRHREAAAGGELVVAGAVQGRRDRVRQVVAALVPVLDADGQAHRPVGHAA